jgi:hypothetical protein
LDFFILRKVTTLAKEMFLNNFYGGMDEPDIGGGRAPQGGWAADVGRHGARKPAVRARGRDDMAAAT